ncbi:MAG: transposase, partial [Nanoarchaeota archaeon]|nr:transposase [Nanoarchaeota archaeon]
GYDYSKSGHYYVTICTDNHKEYFGQIQNNQMLLNNAGNIVTQQWLWLSKQYSYVTLDEFIVMPNHLHGILIISIRLGHDLSRTGHDLSLQITRHL